MSPEEIQALRDSLGENTEQFAAHFHCSRRTVENWEQGRRNPPSLVLSLLQALAASQKKPSRKRQKKTDSP